MLVAPRDVFVGQDPAADVVDDARADTLAAGLLGHDHHHDGPTFCTASMIADDSDWIETPVPPPGTAVAADRRAPLRP